MAYGIFAAIDVGSNDVSMKIFQVSPRTGIKELDYVSRFLALGNDTYKKGMISNELVDELCTVLLLFKDKMNEYRAKEYRAFATSAIREASNREMILDQVMLRTGIKVDVKSNSEHRFLMYKGIAFKEKEFDKIIQKNTAIVDIGAGSIQISVFDKQVLSMTQNIRIGSMRIREMLSNQMNRDTGFHEMVEEYVGNEIGTFQNYFLKEKEVKHIIAIGDEITNLKKIVPELNLGNTINEEELLYIYQKITSESPQSLSVNYGIPMESISLFLPAVVICKLFLDNAKAELIFIPGSDFCDGIVAEYADVEKKVSMEHDFQEDIIATARNIAKRYRCNKTHVNSVNQVAMQIFDRMKSIHGLDKRARLLLQIAAILHDCGKYINMNEGGINSYNIIMSTEIIGLSHKERELVANIVKYNTIWMPAFSQIDEKIDQEDYLMVAKLTSILRIANALDRSHKQKIKELKVSLKDKQLILQSDTPEDLLLEKTLLSSKINFFEEVYGIRPVLKQRRSL